MEEKLASFYLGREYDVQKGEVLSTPIEYDARDLTTHAVCLGMTGSGKTGLCVDLLEEAALDGIPSIVIDPKGDMGNLLLTFPELRPGDFEPWVNVDDARRKALSVEEYAQQTATTWSKGLAEWGQSPERIQRLREAAEFRILTPGSDAGLSVNVMQTLDCPDLSWEDDEETLREKVQSTVSALLGLVGLPADPVKSREHILLSHLFEHSWRAGKDLTVAELIMQIQDPPVRKLGVFDVDTFYPGKERFELSVALNNIIASPSFENWLEGQALDIDQILHRSDGKPRVSIFSVSHLSDAERMFFVTLLLAQVEAWTRKQSGTTSLRGILYFDEIFGYFPPFPANPPSKLPLLRLLKQARAFGLGLVLTTQNPVDLDYKGLTNAGTWFIGKLQTDRDKMRVLEGLEGLDADVETDRSYFDRLISSLSSRVFIQHNVHEERPTTFKTRWAMSYLRGPLTKRQIRTLMAPYKEQLAAPVRGQEVAEGTAQQPATDAGLATVPPRLSAEIPQYFLLEDTPMERAIRQEEQSSGALISPQASRKVFVPALLGWATVDFRDARRNVDTRVDHAYLLPFPEDLDWVDWSKGRVELSREDLQNAPPAEGYYMDVPSGAGQIKKWTALRKDLVNFIYREVALTLFYNRSLRLYSEVGEAEGRFVQRCQEKAAQSQSEDEEKLNAKYEARLGRLEERLEREQQELHEDRIEYEGRKREETLSLGESVLGLFTGRKRSTAFSQASRRRRMTSKAQADVQESDRAIAKLAHDIEELRQEWDEALEELATRATDVSRSFDEVKVKPKKSNIEVGIMGLAWVPYWYVTSGASKHTLRLPAYRGASS